ncbi:hypothetical protein SPRG_16254 [Saprolegnia parasitica CBS 223.65]|uniref:TNFR-Cys domain-containing protein n=1 Tax=Saprolegnia parasitica (strain CBS 223.65) TaxID=695850 RepID=A0A067BVR6_SAPPC|nr:hypothetical protein SPRG_16254 [Saprolegnia parasitica CBS 223.65]KDO18391.1 hypothetical protein SPRG_16254 [Saprolegnia parasitica CBS 223.65]|eukprot:XP_012210902.1 hypothetical protein SPRG_16254 [Saprolegnia parasitica CBS 223.65]
MRVVATLLLLCLSQPLAANLSPICSSMATCFAHGATPCDRATQLCPPCLYTDAKGKNLCYERVTGTKICPFQGTLADCSTTDVVIPKVLNKTATATPEATTMAPEDASVWNGLAIAMTVTTILLLLTFLVLGVLFYRRRSRQLQSDHWLYATNVDTSPVPHGGYKGSHGGFKPSQYEYRGQTNGDQCTPVMADNETQLSACDVMMEAKSDWRESRPVMMEAKSDWRDSRPSNILHH